MRARHLNLQGNSLKSIISIPWIFRIVCFWSHSCHEDNSLTTSLETIWALVWKVLKLFPLSRPVVACDCVPKILKLEIEPLNWDNLEFLQGFGTSSGASKSARVRADTCRPTLWLCGARWLGCWMLVEPESWGLGTLVCATVWLGSELPQLHVKSSSGHSWKRSSS